MCVEFKRYNSVLPRGEYTYVARCYLFPHNSCAFVLLLIDVCLQTTTNTATGFVVEETMPPQRHTREGVTLQADRKEKRLTGSGEYRVITDRHAPYPNMYVQV